MKLTQFVNAMALLEGSQSRVLFDPWVTYGRRSRADIYNFPELAMSPEEIAAIDPDFIYITHTHSDHFDPDTLGLFPKDQPIIISWYEKNFTERMIREIGFTDVRVSDPEAGIALNGDDHCWLNPGTLYPETDSVAVFRIDGITSCNFNDNPFEETYVRNVAEKYGPIDIALCPFAGHGPYPMFYDNLSDAEKTQAARNKQDKYYAEFVKFIDILKPKYAVPFAGGVMCGGDKALRYVNSGIGTKEDAAAYAREHANQSFTPVVLSPRCSYDFETDTFEGDYVEHTYETDRDYIQWVAGMPGRFDQGGEFYIAPSEQTDLTMLLAAARQKQQAWQERRKIESSACFYFDVGDDLLYGLSLESLEIRKIPESEIDDPFYEIFRLPYGLLVGLLTRHYIWSNVKTQYINYYRKPDQFHPDLHFLMNFLHV